MAGDEIELVGPGQIAKLVRQLVAQAQHGQAHLFQLGLPVGAQGRVAEDGRDDPRPVIGREAVILAVQIGHRALRHLAGVIVAGQRHQDAGPFAIDAEILGTRGRDQHLGQAHGDHPRGGGVFQKPVAETLIGKVDQRRGAGLFQHLGNGVPLFRRRVGAGRVVAAAMQQHHIALPGATDPLQHRLEGDATGGIVEIGIHLVSLTHEVQDRDMVRPGRVRDMDHRIRVGHAHQFQRLPNGPGAADRADRGNAAAGHIAQHQRGHRGAIFLGPGEAGIGLAVLALPDLLLGRLDRAHDRRQPGRVLVDTDPEVDLALPRIGLEFAHQGQDLVRGLRLEIAQHHESPVAILLSGWAPHSVQDPS